MEWAGIRAAAGRAEGGLGLTRTRTSAGGAILAGLIVLAGLSLGCASLNLSRSEPSEDPGREVRENAPPEFDVLVALQHDREGRMAAAIAAYERAIAKDPNSAELHLSLAEVLWRSSRFDEAVVHAERALELDAEAHDARRLLAQLYRLRREPEAARGILLDEEGVPYDDESAFMLWQIYLDSGRLEDGQQIAEWMVEADPEDLRARIALANVFERKGKPIEAERVLRDALALDPGNLQIYSVLASSKRERGDHEGEVEIYREILALHGDDHATLVALADAQTEHDRAGAIATLERVEELHPEDVRSAVRLAFLLYDAHRYEEAAKRFERIRSASSDEHEIGFYHGVSASQARMDEVAMEAFLSIPPDHDYYAQARTQIATLHERRGDYALALEEIERAISIAPSRDLELYGATLRAKSGDFEGAVAYLHELIDAEPDNDRLLYNLGVVYGEAERIPEALSYMQQALELNPDNASALNYVGYTWAERGERLDEAEAMIERAIELRPDDGFIVDSLGWVYYMRALPLVKAGDRESAQSFIDRAIDELQRANEMTGGDPVISEHLGDIYLLLDEREAALEQFEEAAALGVREDEQPHLLEKLEDLRRQLR
jgi:tetratricopeptide (TPR) repeat protein